MDVSQINGDANITEEDLSEFSLTSDCSKNSFIMIAYENFFLLSSVRNFCQSMTENFLIDNHYKTIYEWIKSECSSCRVLDNILGKLFPRTFTTQENIY